MSTIRIYRLTDNPRSSILQKLEDGNAKITAQTSEQIEALILENKILRIQRRALYEIAEKSMEIFDTQAELAEAKGESFHAKNNAQLADNIRTVLTSCKEPI